MSSNDTPSSSYQPLTTTSNNKNNSSPTTSSFPTVLRMRSIKHFDTLTTTENKVASSNKKFHTPQYNKVVPTTTSSSDKSDYRVTVRSASISGGGIVVVREKKIEAPEITYLSKTPTSASGGGVIVVQNNPAPPSPSSSSTTPKMHTSGGGIVAQRSSPTSPATMHTLRSNAFHGGCFVRIVEKNTTPVEPRLEIDLARIDTYVLETQYFSKSRRTRARDNNKSDRTSRRRQHSARTTVMDSFEHTYADLLPLKILDDDGDDGQPSKVDAKNSTEGPALTPVKEDIAPRDLRSYFKGKLLFDEPDDPPNIEAVQFVRDDLFVARKKQPRKIVKPSPRTQKNQQKRKSSPRKKQLPRRHPTDPERTIPCDSCNRKFVTLRHMRIHAATHSRKRKKSCRLCPRKFVNEGALANHMRSHKNKSRGEK